MTEIEPDWHFGQNIDLTSSSRAFGGENNHGPKSTALVLFRQRFQQASRYELRFPQSTPKSNTTFRSYRQPESFYQSLQLRNRTLVTPREKIQVPRHPSRSAVRVIRGDSGCAQTVAIEPNIRRYLRPLPQAATSEGEIHGHFGQTILPQEQKLPCLRACCSRVTGLREQILPGPGDTLTKYRNGLCASMMQPFPGDDLKFDEAFGVLASTGRLTLRHAA